MNSAHELVAIRRRSCGAIRRDHPGKIVELRCRRVIVNCADVIPVWLARRVVVVRTRESRQVVGSISLAWPARFLAHIQILAPSAGGSLIRDNDICYASRLRARVPVGVAIQWNTARGKSVRWVN